jgi:hypothetical protein
LYRSRNPFEGRFDSSWDIEDDFNELTSSYRFDLETLGASFSPSDIYNQQFVAGLMYELLDIEKEVKGKWFLQDEAILASKAKKAAKATLHKDQTILKF